MTKVLLLRAPSGDSVDKYEITFEEAGYAAVSVPVLETVLVNLTDMQRVVTTGPAAQNISGVVITSARSCEAWGEVVRRCLSGFSSIDWTKTPFYVVGQATATALAQICENVGDTLLVPRDIRGGTETGTSEKLAHFILEDFRSNGLPKTLLYLTGDKNRDVLPSILKSGNVQLHTLQVYKTQGASSFPTNLRNIIQHSPSADGWWVVYFAPSAADFVTPILREHFAIPNASDELSSTRIAAIGPTTATFLRDELLIRVDVVSPKPNAESLVSSIQTFDDERH
ncbi:tetrapyrrole biosynthesis uroporphyrinogen III synthase [Trametopsis cervina]|nr:tetrapyrrole biosynthesis uroporphyrinogen III synthase [Trametopsis cervina]